MKTPEKIEEIIAFILLLFLSILPAHAQIETKDCFGGKADEIIRDVKQTSDNGLVTTTNLLQIYPNPGKGQFIVRTKDNSMIQSIYLIDITGKEVFHTDMPESMIDAGKLGTGLYTIQVATGHGFITQKIIIE